MMRIPFSYIWRSLWARRLTTALTVGGVALVVFVFAGVLMLARGRALESGRPGHGGRTRSRERRGAGSRRSRAPVAGSSARHRPVQEEEQRARERVDSGRFAPGAGAP